MGTQVTTGVRSRRGILTVALTAAAAAAVTKLGGSVAHAEDVIAGQPVQAGKVNVVYANATKTSGATTYIMSNVADFSVLNAINSGGSGSVFAPALQAFGQSMGIGAMAPAGDAPKISPGDKVGVRAFGATHGVFADSDQVGVYGKGDQFGVQGESDAGAGLLGNSQTAAGVIGGTGGGPASAAIYGYARASGRGIHGQSKSGVGVKAESDTALALEVTGADGASISTTGGTGVALRVKGTVEFSEAGTGTIATGKRKARVSGLTLTAASAAVATLNSVSPDTHVSAVRLVPPDRIVVVLSKKAAKPLTFSYFVFSKAL